MVQYKATIISFKTDIKPISTRYYSSWHNATEHATKLLKKHCNTDTNNPDYLIKMTLRGL